MNDFVIFTDSTTDITPAMIADLDLQVIPLRFFIGEETYQNLPSHSELPIEDFYNKLREGVSASTAQINPTEFEDIFSSVLSQGKDALYICFSSGLSGTLSSAQQAAENLKKQYPNNRILVVDSLAASMGEGLLVYLAVQEKRSGKTLSEVYEWVKENRNHIAHWFTVDDLHHLKRGGRVSATAAIIGSALGIKPVLHVDDEGHLIPVKKVRGRKTALAALVEKLKETVRSTGKQTVFISHGDALADAEIVKKLVKDHIPKADIHINFIGPVIGAHSGPGTIALFFLASGK